MMAPHCHLLLSSSCHLQLQLIKRMFSLRSSLVLFMIFSCTVPAKTLAKQSAACFVSVMREPSTTLRRRHSRLFSIVPAKTLVKHQTVACFVSVMRKPTTLRRHSHLFSSPITSTLELSIPTAQDMDDLGAVLSMDTGPGDTLLLGGDLGAGKTCFSRGFVRARTGDLEQRVTSPTFLLSNTYDAGDVLYECRMHDFDCCVVVINRHCHSLFHSSFF